VPIKPYFSLDKLVYQRRCLINKHTTNIFQKTSPRMNVSRDIYILFVVSDKSPKAKLFPSYEDIGSLFSCGKVWVHTRSKVLFVWGNLFTLVGNYCS